MKSILVYLKKEIVMTLSILLAIATAFVVTPDGGYAEYIDVRTLALLFCLMLVVKGFQGIGAFDLLAAGLFKKVNGRRNLIQILVALCFFSSMLITNDVALITFVPFAILALKKCHLEQDIILTVVLQTIAANLGSMFTPIGNPQNLYLFGISDMGIAEFFAITAPLTGVSLLLLFLVTLFIKNDSVQVWAESEDKKANLSGGKKEMIAYAVLFLVDLAVVLRLCHWGIALLVTVVGAIMIGRKNLIGQVDYALLMTFVGFFIFVGNLGRIPVIRDAIYHLMNGREIVVSALFSQAMSNVPAALLLSGFTDQIKALIVGTNVGGLGTLIASMASLISYKIYADQEGAQKGKYMLVFTIFNVIGLILLLGFSLLVYR